MFMAPSTDVFIVLTGLYLCEGSQKLQERAQR